MTMTTTTRALTMGEHTLCRCQSAECFVMAKIANQLPANSIIICLFDCNDGWNRSACKLPTQNRPLVIVSPRTYLHPPICLNKSQDEWNRVKLSGILSAENRISTRNQPIPHNAHNQQNYNISIRNLPDRHHRWSSSPSWNNLDSTTGLRNHLGLADIRLAFVSPRNLMDRKHIRHDTPPTIIRLNFTALQLIDVRRLVFMTFSFKFIVSSILASEPPLHYDDDRSNRPSTFAMIANHLLLLFRNWSMIFGIVWEQ